MYKNLKVDKEKCIKCGKCIGDCIAKCLVMDKDENIPCWAEQGEARCIKCQHCFAICPTGALSIHERKAENSELVNEDYNSDEILRLIKSRRSYRKYKQENLDEERMNKLKNMLKWVPTGVNNHRLHFSFVDDMRVMHDYRDYVNNKLTRFIEKAPKPFDGVKKKFGRYVKAILRGEDVIFRNAPHMLVVSTPLDAPCKDVDPIIALSYFELYAQSLGVATLWCGLAANCFKMFPEMSELLEIPEHYKMSYVMLFGPSDAKYTRTTQPDEVSIVSVKPKPKDFSIMQRIKRFIWNYS